MEAKQFTRRKFIETMTVAGVSVAVFGISGCTPNGAVKDGAAKAGYTPGTYSASGQGKFAPVNVDVTFTENAIAEVKIVKHEESKYISDTALETIPAAIVEHQSLDIDTITGATLTSMAILTAATDCVKQAGGKASDLKGNYDKPTPSTSVEDLEADVVICGAGASGMVAALNSARLGAKKVIVLEKSCNIGGNSLVSAGLVKNVNAPDALRQDMTPFFERMLADNLAAAPSVMPPDEVEKLNASYEAWKSTGSTKTFDSIELNALQATLSGFGEYSEQAQASKAITELVDWISAEGFKLSPLFGMAGALWPRYSVPEEGILGHSYYEFYSDMIEKNNYPVEIYLNTPATELIVEDGKVCGVVAIGSDGSTYNVRSKTDIVLATGGFSGNPDMMRKYNTMWPFEEGKDILTTNTYGHHGDGINMALKVGATVTRMDVMMPFPSADIKNGADETDVPGALRVNKEGKRFVNETMDRPTIAKATIQQTDNMYYSISDADSCGIKDGKTNYGHDVENLLAQEQLYRADSLEELAGKIGCDPAVFTATIERFNEIARTGDDPDFGRGLFSKNTPVETPPFYASPRTWAMHITEGGLVADVHDGYKVLDGSGNPIPGLRAIGETISPSFGNGVMGEGFAVAQVLFGNSVS